MMLVRDNKNRSLLNPWFNFPQIIADDFMGDISSSTGLNVWEDEKSNKIIVEAAFPGLNSKDIDVELKNGVLTMRADREESDEKEKDGKKIHSWSMKSSYYYSTILPNSASNDVDAQLKDGVLRLEIKKTEESRPKKIEIKS